MTRRACKSLRVLNYNETSEGSLKESDKIAAKSLTAHDDNDLEGGAKETDIISPGLLVVNFVS